MESVNIGVSVVSFWDSLLTVSSLARGRPLPEFPPAGYPPKGTTLNYYQHHIGDFIRDTSRLSDAQCMAYLRMIWMYYESESPLTDNLAVLALKLGSDEPSISMLLAAFFKKDGDTWRHSRCDNELEKYHRMSEGGKRGAANRWGSSPYSPPIAPPSPPLCDPNANQEPITNNQEPSKTLKPKTAPATPLPEWLDENVWSDFKAHRVASKSKMTARAEALAIGELSKLKSQGHDPTEVIKQSIMRGWKGLFALNGHDHAKGKSRHEQLADKLADLTGQNRRNKPGPEGVIHGTAERVD